MENLEGSESVIDAETAADDRSRVQAAVFPGGWADRLWFAWVTVVVPAISFGLSLSGLHLVDWKSPGLRTWIGVFLDQAGTFIPLAVVVGGACLWLVVRPGRWAERPVSRVVFAFGFGLAVPFGIATMGFLSLSDESDLGTAALRVLVAWLVIDLVSLAIGRGGRWLVRRVTARFGTRRALLGSAACLAVLWSTAVVWMAVESVHVSWPEAMFQATVAPFALFFFISLAAAPIWSARALWQLQRRLGPWPGWNRTAMGSLAVMVAGYAVSWRLAVAEVVEAYDALPAEPPDCFVATAAARGPRWVGGVAVPTVDGGRRQITPQLQRLKLFELLWKAAWPASHRGFRWAYDRLGPAVARAIRGPWLAGLVWLALKPVEWLAVGITRWLLGREAGAWRRRLYRGASPALPRRDRLGVDRVLNPLGQNRKDVGSQVGRWLDRSKVAVRDPGGEA